MLYGKTVVRKLDDEDLPAKLEVAVIKLYWDSACTEEAYFDPGTIMDIDVDYRSSVELPFTCFGYPSGRGVTIRSNEYYEANDGYWEFIVSDNESFEGGFSGALFVDKQQYPYAIAYSCQENGRTHAYGIPISLASKRAHEVLDKEM